MSEFEAPIEERLRTGAFQDLEGILLDALKPKLAPSEESQRRLLALLDARTNQFAYRKNIRRSMTTAAGCAKCASSHREMEEKLHSLGIFRGRCRRAKEHKSALLRAVKHMRVAGTFAVTGSSRYFHLVAQLLELYLLWLLNFILALSQGPWHGSQAGFPPARELRMSTAD